MARRSKQPPPPYEGWCRQNHSRMLHYRKDDRLLCGYYQDLIDRELHGPPAPAWKKLPYLVPDPFPDAWAPHCKLCRAALRMLRAPAQGDTPAH